MTLRFVLAFVAVLVCARQTRAVAGEHESEAKQDAGQSDYTSKDSLFSFFLNLAGYGSVIIPAALFIRHAQKSKWLNEGTGSIYSLLRTCIVEKPDEAATPTKTMEEGGQKADNEPAPPPLWHTGLLLLFCAVGLQLSYLTWGVLQERIMTQEYDGVKFRNSQFLVFVNRILAFAVAGLVIASTRQPIHRAPLYKYSYCSISNILSSWCQYEALKFVTFPTQVLAKASKVIPVMIMGKIVSRRSFPWNDYATASLISIGAGLFLVSSEGHGEHGGEQRGASENSVTGLVVLVGYMVFDSFTSNWQSELFRTYKMSPIQSMFGVNLFSCLFTLLSLVEQSQFFSSLAFVMSHADLLFHAVILSICSAVGQLFIFYTVKTFGPVIFTIIMTVRQVLSILLSCYIYNHTLTSTAMIGVVIVFIALFLRAYLKSRASGASERK